jgi:CRP/FNR family transcriptional regulator, nitrogen oxide reductase regulator
LGAKHDSVGTARALACPVPGEKLALAQRFLLFADVSPADCATILSSGHEKHLSRRQPLFSIGDPVRQIFLLLFGTVKITQVGAKGTEVILRLSGTGDLVGSVAVGPECKQNSSAQALQPCTALVWDSPTFARLLEQFAALRRNTFQALDERLHETEQRLREISTEDVASRLSSELIRLSTRVRYGADGNEEVRLSHTDLAQLTGTTLSTVSRLLSRWQKLGIISVGRAGVQIRNIAALEQLSQSD